MKLPSLPHRLQRGLHAFATSCRADPQIPYSIGIMSMYAVAEGATDPLDVTGIDRLSATLVWSACELEVGSRADERGHEEGVASCVEIKGGEHMLACSRVSIFLPSSLLSSFVSLTFLLLSRRVVHSASPFATAARVRLFFASSSTLPS